MLRLLPALAFFPLLVPAAPAPAKSKPPTARCVVASAGERTYDGPCLFARESGGSFTARPARGRAFFAGISSISVALTGRGVAEVRGLTADGINSRWGEARRSRRDPACWLGSGFSICAY